MKGIVQGGFLGSGQRSPPAMGSGERCKFRKISLNNHQFHCVYSIELVLLTDFITSFIQDAFCHTVIKRRRRRRWWWWWWCWWWWRRCWAWNVTWQVNINDENHGADRSDRSDCVCERDQCFILLSVCRVEAWPFCWRYTVMLNALVAVTDGRWERSPTH